MNNWWKFLFYSFINFTPFSLAFSVISLLSTIQFYTSYFYNPLKSSFLISYICLFLFCFSFFFLFYFFSHFKVLHPLPIFDLMQGCSSVNNIILLNKINKYKETLLLFFLFCFIFLCFLVFPSYISFILKCIFVAAFEI